MTIIEGFYAVLALVFLPTSIVAVVAYFLRKLFEKLLTQDVEKFKSDLQTELETYKAGLKATYDLKHTEFQTRFSLLHQKRAEAIERLFSLLSKVQNDLQILTNWDIQDRSETRDEFYLKTSTDLDNLTDFFDEKRIYFDEEIRNGTLEIVRETALLKRGLRNPSSTLGNLEELAKNIVKQNVHPIMNKLESKIIEVLSAEHTE